MARIMLTVLVAAVLVAGCAKPQWPMEPPKKPAVPTEMAKLQPFIGSWTGTAEMVSPSPEEMKKHMLEGAKEPPKTYAVAGKREWTLGGTYFKGEGWYEMGEGQLVNYVEYFTWDAKAKKFRMWYFTDWGGYGDGWMTADPDGKSWRIKASGIGCDGQPMRVECVMTFVAPDTVEWTWKERGSCGVMELKGTEKRQK